MRSLAENSESAGTKPTVMVLGDSSLWPGSGSLRLCGSSCCSLVVMAFLVSALIPAHAAKATMREAAKAQQSSAAMIFRVIGANCRPHCTKEASGRCWTYCCQM